MKNLLKSAIEETTKEKMSIRYIPAWKELSILFIAGTSEASMPRVVTPSIAIIICDSAGPSMLRPPAMAKIRMPTPSDFIIFLKAPFETSLL